MKWLFYTTLGVGVGVALTLLSQKALENRDWTFTARRTIDDFYSKLEDAYDAVRRIDAEDVRNAIMDKLDDIKQRFYEFDIGEVKENAKDVVNNFVYEIKNVLGQVESELSKQWLKLRDQTA